MSQFIILETEKFLSDLEESAVWILESNLEFSETLAMRKVEEFQEEIDALKKRLQLYPESGESDAIENLRKFPIYQGRYSIKWIVQKANQTVILIALTDLKHPKALRNFGLLDL